MDAVSRAILGARVTILGKGYLTILGALLWAACMTMPDIMFHVSHLSQFMKSPSTKAYEALLDVLQYAYQRRKTGITYGGGSRSHLATDLKPEIWSDASFGGKQTNPYGGGFIMWHGACVSWIARRLRFIPLSSCEAEVAALVIMLKEALFVRAILEDLGLKFDVPWTAFTDSASGIDVIKNIGVTKHTTHFARWLHWARDLYLHKWFALTHVTTDMMMADDKTKVLDRAKFLKCRSYQLNA